MLIDTALVEHFKTRMGVDTFRIVLDFLVGDHLLLTSPKHRPFSEFTWLLDPFTLTAGALYAPRRFVPNGRLNAGILKFMIMQGHTTYAAAIVRSFPIDAYDMLPILAKTDVRASDQGIRAREKQRVVDIVAMFFAAFSDSEIRVALERWGNPFFLYDKGWSEFMNAWMDRGIVASITYPRSFISVDHYSQFMYRSRQWVEDTLRLTTSVLDATFIVCCVIEHLRSPPTPRRIEATRALCHRVEWSGKMLEDNRPFWDLWFERRDYQDARPDLAGFVEAVGTRHLPVDALLLILLKSIRRESVWLHPSQSISPSFTAMFAAIIVELKQKGAARVVMLWVVAFTCHLGRQVAPRILDFVMQTDALAQLKLVELREVLCLSFGQRSFVRNPTCKATISLLYRHHGIPHLRNALLDHSREITTPTETFKTTGLMTTDDFQTANTYWILSQFVHIELQHSLLNGDVAAVQLLWKAWQPQLPPNALFQAIASGSILCVAFLVDEWHVPIAPEAHMFALQCRHLDIAAWIALRQRAERR